LFASARALECHHSSARSRMCNPRDYYRLMNDCKKLSDC
jgi:hypothetical protein